jgi:hypothetical protein
MEEAMSKKKACTLTLALGIPYFFCIGLIVGHGSMGEFPIVRANPVTIHQGSFNQNYLFDPTLYFEIPATVSWYPFPFI